MDTTDRRARVLTIGLGACFAIGLSIGVQCAQTACQPLPRGALGWWPGDGLPNDLSPSMNHGSLVNGATFASGAVSLGFKLDGIDDRVDIADTAALRPSRFTLAAWIRADSLVSQACIICKQSGSGDADSYSLWLNAGVLRGGMFAYAEAVAPSQVPLGKFVHVAVTYDGSIIRLYQDGALIAIAAGPASAVPYDSNQVIVGADDNGVNSYAGFFKGIIDEVQIFGRALSGCEIRALYDSRPAGSCKGDTDLDSIKDFVDNCPTISNLAQQDADADGVGDACDCALANASVYTTPGNQYLLRFEARDEPDWCLDPTFTGTATVYDVLRGNLGSLPVTSLNSQCRSRCLASISGLVGWWPGDTATKDLVAGNNGTLENGATYGAGWVQSAFSFDGVNDRVRTGNFTLGNSFTVAAWVNSDLVNQGAYRRLVETSFATGFFVGTDGTGAAFKFSVKSPSAPYGTVNGGKVKPGVWQFVAGSYDGATGTLYVDGAVVASGAFSPPGTVTLPVNIGAYYLGGNTWKGRIDEVQIYNRALSLAELRSLYEAGSAGRCKAPFGATNAEWTAPWAVDSELPAPGHGFWYAYRGRNSCGTGSYGFATNGAERLSSACD